MIIDFHTHTFPDKSSEKIVNHLAHTGCIPPHTDGSVIGLFSSMKEADIDYSVNLPVMTKPSQVEKVNSSLIQQQEHLLDMKIITFGGMHPNYTNYKEELLRLKQAGIPGIKLHPAYQNVDLDDIRMMRIIDEASSLGLITLNAFTASNSVLIPVQCEYYALEGLGQLLNTVELVRKHMNKDFKVEGALLTMYDARTNLSNQVVKEVKRYFEDKVYKNVIPRNVKLSEAPSYGMPITLYDPRSKGAKSYEKFTREFLKINEEEQKAAKHMKKGE